jgi:hypothetical protein
VRPVREGREAGGESSEPTGGGAGEEASGGRWRWNGERRKEGGRK